MKITEACIDRNIDRLITDMCIWDMLNDKDDHYKDATLGYIQGIHDLGEILKEVLLK